MTSSDLNPAQKSILDKLAIIISIVALCFSGLQWYEAHDQRLSSIAPSISFMIADDPSELPVGIDIENAGPGPAKIISLTYFVDKKPVGDVEEATDFENLDDVQFLKFEEGDTLAVGAHEWILKYNPTLHGKHKDKQLDNFLDIIDHHLAVEVEFCPIRGGDCEKKCSTKGWCE